MNDRVRRVKCIAASLAPLIGLALFWITRVALHDPRHFHLGHVLQLALVCGLGPLSLLFVPTWSLLALVVTSLVWSAYALTLSTTRIGTKHWGFHLAISLMWCVLGLFAAPLAALAVT